MAIEIENSDEKGYQIIRAVVDTLQQCNLRCAYCHPGETWINQTLPAKHLEDVFDAANSMELLEITLTGGEITLHPELQRILEATHQLEKPVSTIITNATTINPEIVKQFRESDIGRICVSIDGLNAETHNSARGKTYDQTMQGFYMLQNADKPITVISVAHHENYRYLLELSESLAIHSLATQHHICAPSYSGAARQNYSRFRLREEEFYEMQTMIDDRFESLKAADLYVTFNSFWPATGERSQVNSGREITLVQLTEQLKDCYLIIRSSGDIRLTSAAWGRETVGNAVIGNLNNESASSLFQTADSLYRSGAVKQLPRDIEAQHKFHFNLSGGQVDTNELLDDKETAQLKVEMVTIKPLLESDILNKPLTTEDMKDIAKKISVEPDRYRIIQHSSGTQILFDKVNTHVTLLKPEELQRIFKNEYML